MMAGETAAKGTMGIFIIFVLSRALHPMVIDYSKEASRASHAWHVPPNSQGVNSFHLFTCLGFHVKFFFGSFHVPHLARTW